MDRLSESLKDFVTERHDMVEEQLRQHGINDPRVLAAFESIPRHLFVPEASRPWAYSDSALQLNFGQTISQPFIVALMTQSLHLSGFERILEVGTGSGYQAAILSQLAKEVHTIEFIPELAEHAAQTLADLGLSNINVHTGDGSQGWPPSAPYDAILVAAAAPHTPQPLMDQLADGGRLILPVGGQGTQSLQLLLRNGEAFKHKMLIPVAFVPLRGKHGWTKNER